MPDLASSHAGQQFAQSQFLWVVKMKRKAQRYHDEVVNGQV